MQLLKVFTCLTMLYNIKTLNIILDFMGTGQNCTKTKLHEGTKLHEDKITRRYFRTKTNLHELKKLYEVNLASRVNFARVTILHKGSFLHESKKKP